MPQAPGYFVEMIRLNLAPLAIAANACQQILDEVESEPSPQPSPEPVPSPAPEPSPEPQPAITQTIEGAIAHLASHTSQALGAHDSKGFSRYDKDFGLSLAQQLSAGKRLTLKQRDAAFRTLEKYRNQLASAGFSWEKILETQERRNLAESTTELMKHLVRHRGVNMEQLKVLFEERYGVGETRASIAIDALRDWDKYLSSLHADLKFKPINEYEFDSDEYVDRALRTPQQSDIRTGVILKHSKINAWYKVGKVTQKNFQCIPCNPDGAPIEEKSAFVTIWHSLENYLIC